MVEGALVLDSSDQRLAALGRALLERTSDLLLILDPDGTIRYANRACTEALECSLEALAGRPFPDLVRPEVRAPTRELLAQILQQRLPTEAELELVTASGATLEVKGRLERYIEAPDTPGGGMSILAVFRNLTDQRSIERVKDEFLANVGHELRTPLTSIIAALDLLRDQHFSGSPETVQQMVEIASRNAQRLLRLITRLLDLQRLEIGRMEFHLAPVVLHPLLVEAVEGIEGLARKYEVTLELQQAPNANAPDVPISVVVDRKRLLQVLDNLLSNAIKFSPKLGTVHILLAPTETGARICIADQGPGIPQTFRSQLFQKFAQADASSTRLIGGTGLGLSLSKGLIEAMNGSLSLDETGPSGTTLHIHLPDNPGNGSAAANRSV